MTQIDTGWHRMTQNNTMWPTQCDPHKWPTQFGPHNLTQTIWHTQYGQGVKDGGGDMAQNDIFETKIDNILYNHSMKAHSGNHTLSHHSTKSIPRAYVGKPTCLKVCRMLTLFTCHYIERRPRNAPQNFLWKKKVKNVRKRKSIIWCFSSCCLFFEFCLEEFQWVVR